MQEITGISVGRGLGELPSGQNPFDDHLGPSLQGMVHLVVDLVDEREVEEGRPPGQQQREHPRQVQQNAIDQLHGRMSL